MNNKNVVLLQTASVSVSGFENKIKIDNVQLLFDSGSQRSYISEDLRKKLNFPTLQTKNIVINTFGNKENKIESIDVVPEKFILKNRVIQIECLCTSYICAVILNQNVQQVSSAYLHLKNLTLADSSSASKKKKWLIKEHIWQWSIQT